MRTTSVAVMAFFFESAIPKVFKILSRQLRAILITAFERHLTIGNFKDMDQHWCQACTKTFDLLFHASLPVKQA